MLLVVIVFISVFIGRSVMLLWMGDASVHELYTAACGLYFIWLVCRVGSVLLSWVPLGWKGVAGKVFEWVLLVSTLRNVQCQAFNKGYYFRIVDQKQKMGVNFPPAFLPLRFPAFCTRNIFLTSGTLHTFFCTLHQLHISRGWYHFSCTVFLFSRSW